MNAEPWGAKGLAGQNVTELVLENLNDCILRLRAMGRATKVKSAIEKINILSELDIGVLRALLETRLDPTAENSRLDVPINFTEIPAGEPFAFLLPPTAEADTHSTPGNANISAGGKKARRQAANTRTGAPMSPPTGTQEPDEDPQLLISNINLAEGGFTPEPIADVDFFMSALGLKLVPKYAYPEPEIASRQLANDLRSL